MKKRACLGLIERVGRCSTTNWFINVESFRVLKRNYSCATSSNQTQTSFEQREMNCLRLELLSRVQKAQSMEDIEKMMKLYTFPPTPILFINGAFDNVNFLY